MLKRAVMATAIVYALAGMAQADSTSVMGSFNNTRSKGANHHNTTITQQTQQTTSGRPGPGTDDGRPGAQAQGSQAHGQGGPAQTLRFHAGSPQGTSSWPSAAKR